MGAAVADRKRLAAAAVVEDRIEAVAVAVAAVAIVVAEAVVVAAAAVGIPVMRAREAEAEAEAAAEMVRSAAGKCLASGGEGQTGAGRGRRRRRRAMRCRLEHQFRVLYLWAAQSVEGRFAGLAVDEAAAAAAAAAGRDIGLQRSTLRPRPHLVAATSGARTSWGCVSANRGLTRRRGQS